MKAAIYNEVRVPVIRPNGEIEALPYGYDAQTGVTTLPPRRSEEEEPAED